MRALDSAVVDAVWTAVEGLLPPPERSHPLGCHRRRVPDRLCFEAILARTVLGCSWVAVEWVYGNRVSDTTLRARRDEWIRAGIFDQLFEEALAAYDRIIGLDLSEVAIDGCNNKAPCGGEGTGRNPTDRGKLGFKWSLATDANGIPIAWVLLPANRHDSVAFEPTMEVIAQRGLLEDIETLHLDKGYDSGTIRDVVAGLGIDGVVARRRQPGEPKRALPFKIAWRWVVERSNSWFTNYGQLRRNTDRDPRRRHAQIALAVVLFIAGKLIDWRDRWDF